MEDLFARHAGDRSFTKLALSQGYQQSKKFAVINTNKGIYRYIWFPMVSPLHQGFSKGNGHSSKGYPRSCGVLG